MRECEICNKELLNSQKRFCSKTCYGTFLRQNPSSRNHFKPGAIPWNKGLVGYRAGSAHWNWNGGKRKHTSGYIEILCPEHPNANVRGYVLEHRLVVERDIGRYLEQDEVIHHIDKDKTNNSIENLEVLSRSKHQSMHAKEQWKYINSLIEQDRLQQKGM